MIYTYMIGVYALLARSGKYALIAEDNANNLPVVPTAYTGLVAEYFAK
ncbi:MAG: hypothetical protein H6Q70_1893 [Firmicutes bacterium]|nr:hypothetical protein [Bacillota bacterium]